MTPQEKLNECKDSIHSNMDNKELFLWLIARVELLEGALEYYARVEDQFYPELKIATEALNTGPKPDGK